MIDEEEVVQMAERSDIGKILVAFFAGGVVGALAGLLLAPTSGAETRQKIKEASSSAKDKVLEKIGEAKSGTTTLLHRGKEKIVDVKTQVQAAVEAGKEAYKQKKEELAGESGEES